MAEEEQAIQKQEPILGRAIIRKPSSHHDGKEVFWVKLPIPGTTRNEPLYTVIMPNPDNKKDTIYRRYFQSNLEILPDATGEELDYDLAMKVAQRMLGSLNMSLTDKGA